VNTLGFCRAKKTCGAEPELFARQKPRVFTIAIDDDAVYWTAWDYAWGDGALLKLSKDAPGGTPITLAGGLNDVTGLALHGSDAYFAEGTTTGVDGGTIRKVAKTGQGGMQVLVSPQARPWGIAVDADGTVYWINNRDGRVMKYVP
jgi:hypothetical protein